MWRNETKGNARNFIPLSDLRAKLTDFRKKHFLSSWLLTTRPSKQWDSCWVFAAFRFNKNLFTRYLLQSLLLLFIKSKLSYFCSLSFQSTWFREKRRKLQRKKQFHTCQCITLYIAILGYDSNRSKDGDIVCWGPQFTVTIPNSVQARCHSISLQLPRY